MGPRRPPASRLPSRSPPPLQRPASPGSARTPSSPQRCCRPVRCLDRVAIAIPHRGCGGSVVVGSVRRKRARGRAGHGAKVRRGKPTAMMIPQKGDTVTNRQQRGSTGCRWVACPRTRQRAKNENQHITNLKTERKRLGTLLRHLRHTKQMRGPPLGGPFFYVCHSENNRKQAR